MMGYLDAIFYHINRCYIGTDDGLDEDMNVEVVTEITGIHFNALEETIEEP